MPLLQTKINLLEKTNIDVTMGGHDGYSIWGTVVSSDNPVNALETLREIAKTYPSLKKEIDTCDDYSRTALLLVVDSENIECVKILLNSGAIVNFRNSSGEVPCEITNQNNNADIKAIIKKSLKLFRGIQVGNLDRVKMP